MMYEKMKIRIENVVEQGKLTEEYITNEQEHQVFRKWTQEEFTRQQHPSVIQVNFWRSLSQKESHIITFLLYHYVVNYIYIYI